jgi:rod shape-determining protein MreD
MFVLGFFCIGLFLIIAQSTIFMVHPVWSGAPDLYFILVAYLAYRHDLLRSLIILFPLAMIFDVLSGLVLGMYPALFLLGFLVLKFLSDRLPVRESLYQVPMIGVVYLLVSWIVYICISLAAPELMVPWSWPVMLMRALLVALFSFPLFRFFDFFSRGIETRFSGFKRPRLHSGNRYRE